MEPCIHLKQAHKEILPKTPEGWEECLEVNDSWVHLRLCLTCGHAGCCDSSKNKHATEHFRKTNHPVITSFEKDEHWRWCYIDDVGVET